MRERDRRERRVYQMVLLLFLLVFSLFCFLFLIRIYILCVDGALATFEGEIPHKNEASRAFEELVALSC